ncbi:hypothetical protein CUT44_30715 [Streptomyces carminius]|uniref:Uncharacterized protein n=1 Tax=Streptomyces carminius TaxID=2665496 RepID=A0A2M8LRH7_9ACTN|nr:hypothetical protein [Streptomyces carminius]PJE94571.1 hypothetical protein CUT44_30715 [Streptomyces carminius]
MHTTLRVLERLEGLLLSGEQRTARRNAWNAVLEDRRRARARGEAAALLEAAATGARRAT